MKSKAFTILAYFTLLVLALFFFFWGLVKAKAFLAPLAVAAVLAMVVLPVANWFEHKGMKRGWSSFMAVLSILFFFGVLAGILAFQVKSFSEDWPKMKQKLEPKVNDLQNFIAEKTGISVSEQKQKLPSSLKSGSSSSSSSSGGGQEAQSSGGESQQGQSQGQSGSQSQQSGGGSMMSTAGSFLMKFIELVSTSLLTVVYIFFFLLYREKFKKSIIKMVPEGRQNSTRDVISSATKVSQNYLFGRLILVVILSIAYSIGLLISGVQQAILISILAAVLTLIPYIGNIIGYGLAIAMALFSGGNASQAIGVTLTFGIAQFLETYLLEPFIIGDKVNINPIFTIIVVVLGNALWGVVGMLIAIPALGIAKVIFDHIPVLQPLGYLFGEEDTSDSDSPTFFDKIKNWATNKFT
ncbi:AI-2E family transporter [Telluribacter sp. SYSU D00476]|uniref:AI-2E family transporter n=1 Tax=Telluribacter sp. SYSU D00476 TaxID=2811430 RepID=UPI001FF2DC44|nr:AI-2E family transporter [Telluribacter sp. SYSU D00476]